MLEIRVWSNSTGHEFAAADWGGIQHVAQSNTGAICALARALKASGCPDGPWRVPGRLSGPSLFRMADTTYHETKAGIKRTRYQPLPEGLRR